ncbi:2-aminoethylphosphonate ABC transporter substrate-binding protein [Streptomyces pactum]|uniref:2-aminoethylphosphonate ABC transporter substrate-binding protein n=1 Tax=Streptomyces pactum TaxID=68249 RepID=A0ABS0NIS6_9ACTN|nr:2-aminoethylphosphonate ABC transporter substrate-binding protein [Streptomyces pactum]MBH5335095.1 2-aminoethylphosphonate ABC transporter substrate-binding protein [Streptomyces pactum]
MSLRTHVRSVAAGAGAVALLTSLTACSGSTDSNAKEITVYSADGLHSADGKGFYNKVFKDFEKKTGIEVKYVEGGSGEMVQRLTREKSNNKADVVVTLPPFIQQADERGLLEPYRPAGSHKIAPGDRSADGTWTPVVNNYFSFIYNSEQLPAAPKTWEDLLDKKFENRLQYSTPGVAGDGTALVIKAMHDFGGEEPAMAYLKKLQKNNVGPSPSTGALEPKVDKGELLVANGDVQMNYADAKASYPNNKIFFPAVAADRKPTTFALPYAAGLVKNAPHEKNARKFLDYLLSPEVQEQVSPVAGGFPVRQDVEAVGEDAVALRKILDGVEIFTPDWRDISENLDEYVKAWKEATGS